MGLFVRVGDQSISVEFKIGMRVVSLYRFPVLLNNLKWCILCIVLGFPYLPRLFLTEIKLILTIFFNFLMRKYR